MVVRFPPYDTARLVSRAEKAHRAALAEGADPQGYYYGISVWVDEHEDGETVAVVFARLLAAAGLSGLMLDRNRTFVWSTAGEVRAAAFQLIKEGAEMYPTEPEHHYALDPGRILVPADVDKLLQQFRGPEKTKGHR